MAISIVFRTIDNVPSGRRNADEFWIASGADWDAVRRNAASAGIKDVQKIERVTLQVGKSDWKPEECRSVDQGEALATVGSILRSNR